MTKCILILILISLFLSCEKVSKVENFELFHGVTEFVELNGNNIAFLTNLKSYNNILVLCFINNEGELLDVYPIDKYQNVDVNSNFLKLVKNNKNLLLIYEYRGLKLVIEEFSGSISNIKKYFYRDQKSYGTVFKISDTETSVYIKSSLIYDSKRHKGYQYNYFYLDNNLEKIKSGIINLGDYHPDNILIFNEFIYFTVDKQLFRKSLNGITNIPVYNFDNEIIEIKEIDNNLFILLEDTVFIVDNSDEVIKSFTLNHDNTDYKADAIIKGFSDSIIISLKSKEDSLFKEFTIHGSQLKQYIINIKSVGDSFIYNDKTIFYSSGKSLYLKDL